MRSVTLACVALVGSVVLASEQPFRGVPYSRRPEYEGSQVRSNPLTDARAACPLGSFYCANRGFRGKAIPSSQVNDGVCDCCDASDEYASGAPCTNTCAEDGRAWREHLRAQIQAAEAGAKQKQDYIAQSRAAAEKRAQEKAQKKELLEAKQRSLTEAQEQLDQAKQEAQALLDAKAAEEVPRVLEGLGLTDASREDIVRLLIRVVQDANAKEHVESAARSLARERATQAGSDPAAAADAVSWAMDEDADSSSSDATPEDASVSSAESAVQDARKARDQAERDLDTLESDDATDYGPEGAFFPLKGQCFKLDEAQYTYEICPFEKARQDSVALGTFSGWKDADHTEMEFTDGASCWQGPRRSTLVRFECGTENRVVDVDEPSKCTYVARMTTPAACSELFAQELRLELEPPERGHDEL